MQHHHANRLRVIEAALYGTVVALCLAFYVYAYTLATDSAVEVDAAPTPAPPVHQEAPAEPEKRTDSMADTGWIALSTFASVGATYDWQNPSNAATDDGSYTTLYHEVDTQSTSRLDCTGIASAVPAGAAIDEIDMRYEVRVTGLSDSLQEDVFKFLIGGVWSGVNFGNPVPAIGGTPELRTHTGILTTSGLSLTDDDVNAANFGFGLTFIEDNSGNDGTVEIDYVQIRIHYTPATEYGTIDATLPGLNASSEGKSIGTAGATLPGLTTKAHYWAE